VTARELAQTLADLLDPPDQPRARATAASSSPRS
jgi:hypothetical protein